MPKPEKPAPPRGWRRLHLLLRRGDSAGWLAAAGLQALLTLGFMALSRSAEGWRFQREAKLLMLLGIVATWGLTLRAIRERLVELIRYWRVVSHPHRRRQTSAETARKEQERLGFIESYVKRSMLRLRVTAAGVTMPFFLMPFFVSGLCVWLYWERGRKDLVLEALLFTLAAAVVFVYFHWVVLPAPARAAAARRQRRGPVRRWLRWWDEEP